MVMVRQKIKLGNERCRWNGREKFVGSSSSEWTLISSTGDGAVMLGGKRARGCSDRKGQLVQLFDVTVAGR